MPESPTRITDDEELSDLVWSEGEGADTEQETPEEFSARINRQMNINNARDRLKESVKSIIESILNAHDIELADATVTNLAEQIANTLFSPTQDELTEEQLEAFVNVFIHLFLIPQHQATTQQGAHNHESSPENSDDDDSESTNSGESVALQPYNRLAEPGVEHEDIDDATPNPNPELTRPDTFDISEEGDSDDSLHSSLVSIENNGPLPLLTGFEDPSDDPLHLSALALGNQDELDILPDLAPPHGLGWFSI